MWKYIALAVTLTMASCFFLAQPAQAEGGEWSIGVGAQFRHTNGPMVDVKYTRPFGKGNWIGWYSKLAMFDGQPAASVGLHFDWTKWFYTGIGIGVTKGNDIVSTAYHYESPIIGFRITDKLSLEASHRSNCSSLWKFTGDRCLYLLPRGTTPNLGYNFLTLRRRF